MKRLYHNGIILTMADVQPQVEAVLVEDGRISMVGKLCDLENFVAENEKIDLRGKTLLPGFIDSHSHITVVALSRLFANLTPENGVKNISALLETLRKHLEEADLDDDEWLIGMNYDDLALEEKRHPTRFELDQVSKEKPIVCVHVSSHICSANSKALELYGYYDGCEEVPGGVIQRVPGSSVLNGVLEETAFQSIAFAKTGFPKPDKIVKALLDAEKYYASQGYTTVSEISCLGNNVKILKWMADQNQHIVDVMIHCLNLDDIESFGCQREYTNHLRCNGAKIVLDGSPQAETAWLTEPYYKVLDGKAEDYCGYPSVSDEALYRWIKRCVSQRWPIALHCNGDAAADQYLNIYEKVWREEGAPEDLRPVMIHCQTVRDDQLDRMKVLGMSATFFIGHIYYWGDLHYEVTLGPLRANRISPLKSAVNGGINYTLHQDAPVTPPNQLLSIHTAVNRETKNGRLLGKDQCITVEEAFRAATINAAYQHFEETLKGSIEPGKLADFVVLDKNPFEIDPSQIKQLKVLATIKEGNEIYTRE